MDGLYVYTTILFMNSPHVMKCFSSYCYEALRERETTTKIDTRHEYWWRRSCFVSHSSGSPPLFSSGIIRGAKWNNNKKYYYKDSIEGKNQRLLLLLLLLRDFTRREEKKIKRLKHFFLLFFWFWLGLVTFCVGLFYVCHKNTFFGSGCAVRMGKSLYRNCTSIGTTKDS